MESIEKLKIKLSSIENQIKDYSQKLSEKETELQNLKIETLIKEKINKIEKLRNKLYVLYSKKSQIENSLIVYQSNPIASNEIIDLYKQNEGPKGDYLACLHNTKTIIGELGYNNENNNVHYVIYEQYRNNGYATQSLRLLLEYLIICEIEEIEIVIEKDNLPSLKTLEKVVAFMEDVKIEDENMVIICHINLSKNNKLKK